MMRPIIKNDQIYFLSEKNEYEYLNKSNLLRKKLTMWLMPSSLLLFMLLLNLFFEPSLSIMNSMIDRFVSHEGETKQPVKIQQNYDFSQVLRPEVVQQIPNEKSNKTRAYDSQPVVSLNDTKQLTTPVFDQKNKRVKTEIKQEGNQRTATQLLVGIPKKAKIARSERIIIKTSIQSQRASGSKKEVVPFLSTKYQNLEQSLSISLQQE